MTTISRSPSTSVIGASDIFQLLRNGEPRTRAELATVTGLARSTIALRIDQLVSLGLVGPVNDAQSTGGRPSSQFALKAGARVVIAADLGATHATVAVVDLGGKVLATVKDALDIQTGPESVLDWAVSAAQQLLTSVKRASSDVVSIGIGLPGPVEHLSGKPVNPPIMPGWDGFDVPAYVRNTFPVPVLVDNDVNIMALGERAHAWPDTDDLIFVKVSTGIGSGVISGGLLQRGAQGIAGDIGHVRIERGKSTPCHCGNRGCLEAMASGPAIVRKLQEHGLEVRDNSDVIELVRLGNIDAIQAIRQAGRDLGDVLSACVSLMNPAVIVVGGSMAAVGEHIIAGVREVIYARSMPLATRHLTIVSSNSGVDIAILGASILAIEHALSPASIDLMTH